MKPRARAKEAKPQEPTPAGPRRIPTQQRSRERFERILAIANGLIARRGSDSLRMSEVAELAGISIGSLYQYFPDKPSIIRTLAERYNEQGRACVQVELVKVHRDEELTGALVRVVDGYHQMFEAEPAMRHIWGATQADRTLQAMDEADAQAHAAMLCEVLVRLRPRADKRELEALALLTMQLIATAVRLAISVEPPQGEAVLAAFKRMLPANLFDLLPAGRRSRA